MWSGTQKFARFEQLPYSNANWYSTGTYLRQLGNGMNEQKRGMRAIRLPSS